jgi:hypothetical protein
MNIDQLYLEFIESFFEHLHLRAINDFFGEMNRDNRECIAFLLFKSVLGNEFYVIEFQFLNFVPIRRLAGKKPEKYYDPKKINDCLE